MARSERDHVLVGLIGAGIGKSLSPLLHQREADRQGLRLVYTIVDSRQVPIGEAELPELLRWARALGFRGLNVTHPFKQHVVKYLDELSIEARAVGAVNTIVFERDRMRGYNTDWSGYLRGFERHFADAPRERVVQLGAGGAGSAVAHAMLTLGAGHLVLIDVDGAKANELAVMLGGAFGAHRISVGAPDDLPAILATAQGVINATPIGMTHLPGSPIAPSQLRPDLWVSDIVYRPADTALLQAARAAGARTLDGSGMCTFQAVAAFEYFTGATAHVDMMLADLTELLSVDV